MLSDTETGMMFYLTTSVTECRNPDHFWYRSL